MKKQPETFDEILSKIPADKRYVGEKLIAELVFIEKTLDRLKVVIDDNDLVESFKQGKQDFTRELPALKAYTSTVQRYSVIYRQLTDLMGKSAEAEKSNAVYDFLKEA